MHRSHALDLSHTFCRIPVDGSWNQRQPTAQYLLNTPAVGSMSGHFYINGCRIWHEIRRGIQFLSSFPVVHPPPPRPLGSVPRGGWSPAVWGGGGESHVCYCDSRKKNRCKNLHFLQWNKSQRGHCAQYYQRNGAIFYFLMGNSAILKKWILVAEMAFFKYIHIILF
jgi:hypothetical protein